MFCKSTMVMVIMNLEDLDFTKMGAIGGQFQC